MAVIYTLMGIVYTPVIDPVRGIVLRKAARKRAASPGQMSLFGSNEPKQGDTKVVDGVTYQLNQHSRWEKTDKAKGKGQNKPKAVVPVVEEKSENTQSPIANMQQKGDTGSRDKKKGKGPQMIRLRVDSYEEAERLENIAVDLNARINQEGFPTSYGGTGIIVYIQSPYSKRHWNQIISGFNTVSFI